MRWGATGGCDGRGGLQMWPEGLEAGGHASLPSALAAKWRWLLSGHLSLATPPHPPVAPHRTPPHANRYAHSAARLYPDNPVPTAPVRRRLRRTTARYGQHSDGAGGKTCVDVSHSRAGSPARARPCRAVVRHDSPCPPPWRRARPSGGVPADERLRLLFGKNARQHKIFACLIDIRPFAVIEKRKINN